MSLYHVGTRADNQNGINEMKESGLAVDRPTKNLYIGRRYFDTTRGQAIWYDGTGWVIATGINVDLP